MNGLVYDLEREAAVECLALSFIFATFYESLAHFFMDKRPNHNLFITSTYFNIMFPTPLRSNMGQIPVHRMMF